MPWNDNMTPVFAFGVTTGIALTAATQYLLTALVGNNRKQIVEVPVPSEPLSGQSLARKESGILTQHTRSLLRLEKEFTVSGQRLQTLVRHMVQEMKKGLAADGHQLKMIPSFVVRRPTGNETGSVLALDLGGSNFRVCEVYLEGQGRLRMRHRKYVVGDDLKRASGRVLFDFFAEKIEVFLDEIAADKSIERNLGFTFSFPVGQPALAQGICQLIRHPNVRIITIGC